MKFDLSIHKVFSLGRGLDWSLPYNRFAIIFSVITFIVFIPFTMIFVTSDYTSPENLIFPFEAAVLSFLAWAFAREFDPEDSMTAIFAQVLMTLVVFWFFPDFGPVLLGTLLLLLMVRVVNRLGGRELVDGDYILMVLLGLGLTIATGNWLYAMIVSFGFLAYALFADKTVRSYVAAIIAGGVSVYFIITESVVRQVLYFPALFEYLLVFLLVVTLLLRFFVRNKITIKDDQGKKADQSRILAGAGLLLLGTVGLTIFGGEFGYMTASPGWAVIVVYPLVSLLNRE